MEALISPELKKHIRLVVRDEMKHLRAQNEKIASLQQELVGQREIMILRFAAMDKRFEEAKAASDKRFEENRHYMDKRFEAVDKRFEENRHYMEKRFEAVDRRFAMLMWAIGLGFTLTTVLMSLYRFLG